MDKCMNCRTANGMAARSAKGYYHHDGSYVGGLCPNCVFYPERVSASVRARIEAVSA